MENTIHLEVMTSINLTLSVNTIPGLTFKAVFDVHITSDDVKGKLEYEYTDYSDIVYLGKAIKDASDFRELATKNMDSIGINLNKVMSDAADKVFKETFPGNTLQEFFLVRTLDFNYYPETQSFIPIAHQ